MGSGENGKRYQLLINQPARLLVGLAGLYPYIQAIFFSTADTHPITTTVQP